MLNWLLVYKCLKCLFHFSWLQEYMGAVIYILATNFESIPAHSNINYKSMISGTVYQKVWMKSLLHLQANSGCDQLINALMNTTWNFTRTGYKMEEYYTLF